MNKTHFENFISFVKNNYFRELNVEEISKRIGCSKSYLHEILVCEMDLSIMQYVTYYRLIIAIDLILKGEKRVYQKVGYISSSTFSKTFHRITGITIQNCSQYRAISSNIEQYRAISSNIEQYRAISSNIEQ